MHKKSQLFSPKPPPPTKRQLIAAAEYAKNPELISNLCAKLAFVREEKPITAKKKRGQDHARR